MKKLFFLLAICLPAVCITVPAAAAETDGRTIDVSAKYVSELPWNTVMPDENGKAKITLTDGTEISVDGIPNNRWTLVVDVITEQEVLEYINGIAKNDFTNRLHLHIFFLDENRTVHSAQGMGVSVQTAIKSGNPAAYALSGGNLKSVPLTAEGSALRFAATGDTVYILGNIRQNTPDLSKTGDTANLTLWIILTLVGVSGICVTRKEKRIINS